MRRVPRPAEDQHDAEGREREQEDDRGGGRECRREQRSVTSRKRAHGRRAERRGRLVQARIEARPERPDDPHDDGDVEERVRDQDRRPAALDAVGQDREERERDDDRREHERDDDERAHHAPAPESVAAEHVRGRQRDRDREHGRRERLPHREPHDLARQRIREDVERRRRLLRAGPARRSPRAG